MRTTLGGPHATPMPSLDLRGAVPPRPDDPPTTAAARTDEPTGAGGAPVGVRGRAPVWLVLLAVSLPMFMATLDNLVMTSALPVIQVDLSATVSELQWFMTAYTLAFAALMLAAAGAGDRWGDRKSTRLNSSHVSISYAVFCLKKKK